MENFYGSLEYYLEQVDENGLDYCVVYCHDWKEFSITQPELYKRIKTYLSARESLEKETIKLKKELENEILSRVRNQVRR